MNKTKTCLKNATNVMNNLANFEANIFKDSFQKYKRSNTITLGDKGIRFRNNLLLTARLRVVQREYAFCYVVLL